VDDAGRPTVTTTALTPGLPAAAALQVGDRVLAVDGVAVATMDAVAARVQMRLPGDTVVLRLVRAGVTQEVALVLGDLADMETEE
jgi:S1-C subfamily serine protease